MRGATTDDDPGAGDLERAAWTSDRVRAGVSPGSTNHLVHGRLRVSRASTLRRGREQVRVAGSVAPARGSHGGLSQIRGVPRMEEATPPLLRSVSHRRAL